MPHPTYSSPVLYRIYFPTISMQYTYKAAGILPLSASVYLLLSSRQLEENGWGRCVIWHNTTSSNKSDVSPCPLCNAVGISLYHRDLGIPRASQSGCDITSGFLSEMASPHKQSFFSRVPPPRALIIGGNQAGNPKYSGNWEIPFVALQIAETSERKRYWEKEVRCQFEQLVPTRNAEGCQDRGDGR